MSAPTAALPPWPPSGPGDVGAELGVELRVNGHRPPARTGSGATDGEPVSHLDLIAGARRLQRPAVRGDADELHAELCRFREALLRHVEHERDAFVHLSAVAQQIIGRGQRQILDQVDHLVATAGPDEACRARLAELTWRLRRQARLEAGLLHERPR